MKLLDLKVFVKRLNTGVNAMVTAGDLDASLKETAFTTVLASTLKNSPLSEVE